MTIFDLIAFGVVAFSALMGFNRGAVAELLGLFALALSALATIAFLPATASIARHFLHSGWISAIAAAAITFAVVFLFLRFLAAVLTSSINRSSLSDANRFGGLAFGAIRGVVVLGLFALLFNRVTPQEQKPGWITGATTYPMIIEAGGRLQQFLPRKLDLAGGFGGALTNSINEESARPDENAPAAEATPASETSEPPVENTHPSSERAKSKNRGYTEHARDSVDALVERSK